MSPVRSHPPGQQRLGRRLGPAPVARHHHRAPDEDLAVLALGQHPTVVGADLEVDGRQRPSRRLRERDQLLARVDRRRARRTPSGRSRRPSTRGCSGSTARARSSSAGENAAPPPPPWRRPLRSYSASRGWCTMRCSIVGVYDQPGDALGLDELHHELLVEATERPHRSDARDHERDRAHVQPRDVEERIRHELADRSVGRVRDPAAATSRCARRGRTTCRSAAITLRCVLTAPFGRPVVPLV